MIAKNLSKNHHIKLIWKSNIKRKKNIILKREEKNIFAVHFKLLSLTTSYLILIYMITLP